MGRPASGVRESVSLPAPLQNYRRCEIADRTIEWPFAQATVIGVVAQRIGRRFVAGRQLPLSYSVPSIADAASTEPLYLYASKENGPNASTICKSDSLVS